MDINREDIVLPRKNYSIRGHKENINFLINSFLSNSLHHAYIFSGNKGIGKATLAYLLSRKILSDNKTKKLEVFDNKVSKLIEANSHPDLLVIEPEGNDKKSFISDLPEGLTTIVGHLSNSFVVSRILNKISLPFIL